MVLKILILEQTEQIHIFKPETYTSYF